MIDNTLLGYSVLNTLNEQGKDIIDTYIPLCCYCIEKYSGSETITKELLKQWLDTEYGLSNVTLGAAESFLRRMSGKYLIRENGTYKKIDNAVTREAEKTIDNGLEMAMNSLCDEIEKYAKKQYEKDYTHEEIENGIVLFLDKSAKDIILDANNLHKELERQKEKSDGDKPSNTLQYIISSFILEAYNKQNTSVVLIEQLAKGHAIASIIAFDNLQQCVGNMNNVMIAIDAPILFNLLELNGEPNKDLTTELIENLKNRGSKLLIFDQHYNEVINTLQDAIGRLTTHQYHYEKSSRVLKYAIRNQLSASFIQTKLAQVDDILKRYEIEISSAPSLNYHINIDEQKLTTDIETQYLHDRVNIEQFEKERIATDVDVISHVFHLRGMTKATTLKNCKAILLTNNQVLARASRNKDITVVMHDIPVCCTDIFLSTILWVNFPKENNNLNKKVLLSHCYANTVLSDAILRKFYNEVKILNEQNYITQDQVLQICSSRLAISLLGKKTMNDEELYTDYTTDEIIKEVQLKQEYELKIAGTSIEIFAHRLALICFWMLWLILCVIFLLVRFLNTTDWQSPGCIVYYMFASFTAVWGLLVWSGIIKNKKSCVYFLEHLIKKRIYSMGRREIINN